MNAIIRPSEIIPEVVPLTVEALRVLDDQGFFDNDPNRYELIDGFLIMTPPPGSNHRFTERRAAKALFRALIAKALDEDLSVQTGGAFQIGDKTLLGPDLVVIQESNAPTDPAPSDVIIMVQIAWSSRERDLKAKADLYAGAGIEDYWVLDVPAKTVIVHRDPEGGIYQSVQTFAAPASISALREPRLSIAVADLF
jgi:Uma2 family endonuclease